MRSVLHQGTTVPSGVRLQFSFVEGDVTYSARGVRASSRTGDL